MSVGGRTGYAFLSIKVVFTFHLLANEQYVTCMTVVGRTGYALLGKKGDYKFQTNSNTTTLLT